MNDHEHCPVCSALVRDIEVHANWHGELDQAIELAVRQQSFVQGDDEPQQVEGGTL